MARQELRSGVNHNVSTQIQGTLQNRGREGVVHRGHNAQAAGSSQQGRQVSDLKHRVRGALQPRQDLRLRVVHVLRGHAGAGCGILHSGDNALGVFNVHANELNDAAALQILAQGHRRHVCVLRNQNNGANRHQVDDSSDSSHTGGEQQTRLGSVLQLRHNLFHALPGGVREAGVHAVLLNIDGVHTTVGGRKNDWRVHRRVMLVCRAAARDDEGLCGVIHVVVICTHVFKPGTPAPRTHARAGDGAQDLHVFYLDTHSIPRGGITKTAPVQLRDPVPLKVMDTLSYTPDAQNLPADPTGRRGLFIVVEGGDGAGKTTQLTLLNEALSARGYRVITTREPGGTEIGEKLRALVLEAGQGTIDDRTEALIFAASRAAHASQLIRPALAEGAIVLSDRYIDSSAAYQGVGRDLGIETIVDLSRWATADLVPDATLLLSVPLSAEQERMDQRGTVDRIEAEGAAFKARIHGAFEQIAREDANGSHRIIDGGGTIEQVHARVLEVIEPLLAARELVRTGKEDS